MTNIMPVLMNDFSAEPAEIRAAMLAAARRVVDSGWFVLGKEVQKFEEKWAEICGVTYGVGVANGMDAIEIALRVAGIGPGDEVITTAMTAFASVLAILRAGATPVLADIEEETALLSKASVQRCLTNKTKAILLVHLYGQLADMEAWEFLCSENNIKLIEDCAQAHLASWGGRIAGSFGLVGAYSFYPTKNLGAPGDAGMLICQDSDLAAKAKRIRNYGQSERYYHPEIGMNSRLDELQASMLTARLPWLKGFTDRRRQIAHIYEKGISNSKIRLLARPAEVASHVYHLYVITTPLRDSLASYLSGLGIQTFSHYPVPIHRQESCKTIHIDPGGLPACERHADQCLSLPCHPQMADEDVLRVIEAINSFDR